MAEEYLEFKNHHKASTNQTVVLFLVDGMSYDLVSHEMKNSKLPNFSQFFKAKISKAHTTFPSLTFPAIASILTERPVDENGVYGNLILKDSEVLDLTYPSSYHRLNEMMKGHNIFSRLTNHHESTLSFDYGFGGEASVSIDGINIESGISVISKDYATLDQKMIDSLQALLSSTEPHQWPEFIFVHLVGVDFLSHDHGPDSTVVKEYLESLDQKLTKVFSILQSAGKQREIISLMTSDHGFDQKISKVFLLEEVIHKIDSKIKILNEGRYLALYFPESWSEKKRSHFLDELLKKSEIDMTAELYKQNISIRSHTKKEKLTYNLEMKCTDDQFALQVNQGQASCPNDLASGFYPYFDSNIAHYFRVQGHPDAVVFSKSGVSFLAKDEGQHGGPTSEEVFVPLLARNAKLSSQKQLPAIWQLLKFITSSEY